MVTLPTSSLCAPLRRPMSAPGLTCSGPAFVPKAGPGSDTSWSAGAAREPATAPGGRIRSRSGNPNPSRPRPPIARCARPPTRNTPSFPRHLKGDASGVRRPRQGLLIRPGPMKIRGGVSARQEPPRLGHGEEHVWSVPADRRWLSRDRGPGPGGVLTALRAPSTVASSPSPGERVRQEGHVECAVIVVTYNSAADISPLLESLPAAAEGLALRIVVVDNGSSDTTVEVVRRVPGVTCVETGANLGYAGAINVGRAHVGPCSSVLILNPDLVLEPGSVSALFAALADPGVGVTVPQLLDGRGSVYWSLRREPTIGRALGDALFGDRFPSRPGWASEIVRTPASYQRGRHVDWATGAVMLIAADCDAAVGAWDDVRFFMYSEETDFAARARARGWSVEYVPSARASHRQAGSGHRPELDVCHATAPGRGAGEGPDAPGGTARAVPAPDRRAARHPRPRRPPRRADLPGRGGDHPVLPGIPRLPAGRAGGEPRLRGFQPLLLRHRQQEHARLLRLPRA